MPVPQVPAAVAGKENNRYSQQFPALPSRPSALATPTPAVASPYGGAPASAQTSTASVASTHSRTGSSSARASPVPATTPVVGSSNTSVRARTDSAASSVRSASSSIRPVIGAHGRSASSSDVSIRTAGSSFDSGSRSATPVQATVGKKPSPLSRANATATAADEDDEAEDSDDTAGPASVAKGKTGLGARFKKLGGGSSSAPTGGVTDGLSELSIDGRRPPVVAHNALQHHNRGDSSSSAESSTPRTPPSLHANLNASASGPGSASSSRPPNASKSGRFSMLNGKFNGSSDNLSISSTVSSASMMLRKIGNMGKIARRSSMMSLSKAFGGKKKDKGDTASDSGGEEPLKMSKKDRKKAQASGTSVSHATVEIEPHENGISPAAALAKKQQRLYAEQDAARQKAKEEAERAAEREASRSAQKSSFMVHERNGSSASLASMAGGGKEKKKKSKWGFGGKKDKENHHQNDDSNSSFRDDASIRVSHAAQGAFGGQSAAGNVNELYDDPDRTPRQSLEVLEQPYGAYGALPYDESNGHNAAQQHVSAEEEFQHHLAMGQQMPTWRRDAKAARGVLKGAGTYNQDDFNPNGRNAQGAAGLHRARASSFDASDHQAQQGPHSVLTHELPDATTIDGAAVAEARASTHGAGPLRPLHLTESPRPSSPAGSSISGVGSANSPYSLPAANASAPALNHPGLSTATPLRAASSPGGSGKRISFAQNLSVHTTWPASVYDRKPELGTCNKLTPTLAQRIKEELNAFKMEEMEVHPNSRHWTQFFV